jgi:hypothetical protein
VLAVIPPYYEGVSTKEGRQEMATFTKQTAHAAADQIRATYPGLTVTVRVGDGIVDGQLVQLFWLDLRVADPSTGNGETRQIRSPEEDVCVLVAEARGKLKASVKRTRAAIRAERRFS